MHAPRDVARERALGNALLRRRLRCGVERLDLLAAHQREVAEEAAGVAILHRQPELVERIWRRTLGIEPHRTGFRLSELRATRIGHEWHGEAMRLGAVH